MAREQMGLSQVDVAKSLGVSASAVNQWEQGLSKNIKLHHFFALARLLRQDPQWLATSTAFPYAHRVHATPPDPDEPPLSREEHALLQHVRLLPDPLRRHILKFVRGLSGLPVGLSAGQVGEGQSDRRG